MSHQGHGLKRPYDHGSAADSSSDHAAKLQNTGRSADPNTFDGHIMPVPQSALQCASLQPLGYTTTNRSPSPSLSPTPSMYSSPRLQLASHVQAGSMRTSAQVLPGWFAAQPTAQNPPVPVSSAAPPAQYPLSSAYSLEQQKQLYAVALAFNSNRASTTSPPISSAATPVATRTDLQAACPPGATANQGSHPSTTPLVSVSPEPSAQQGATTSPTLYYSPAGTFQLTHSQQPSAQDIVQRPTSYFFPAPPSTDEHGHAQPDPIPQLSHPTSAAGSANRQSRSQLGAVNDGRAYWGSFTAPPPLQNNTPAGSAANNHTHFQLAAASHSHIQQQGTHAPPPVLPTAAPTLNAAPFVSRTDCNYVSSVRSSRGPVKGSATLAALARNTAAARAAKLLAQAADASRPQPTGPASAADMAASGIVAEPAAMSSAPLREQTDQAPDPSRWGAHTAPTGAATTAHASSSSVTATPSATTTKSQGGGGGGGGDWTPAAVASLATSAGLTPSVAAAVAAALSLSLPVSTMSRALVSQMADALQRARAATTPQHLACPAPAPTQAAAAATPQQQGDHMMAASTMPTPVTQQQQQQQQQQQHMQVVTGSCPSAASLPSMTPLHGCRQLLLQALQQRLQQQQQQHSPAPASQREQQHFISQLHQTPATQHTPPTHQAQQQPPQQPHQQQEQQQQQKQQLQPVQRAAASTPGGSGSGLMARISAQAAQLAATARQEAELAAMVADSKALEACKQAMIANREVLQRAGLVRAEQPAAAQAQRLAALGAEQVRAAAQTADIAAAARQHAEAAHAPGMAHAAEVRAWAEGLPARKAAAQAQRLAAARAEQERVAAQSAAEQRRAAEQRLAAVQAAQAEAAAVSARRKAEQAALAARALAHAQANARASAASFAAALLARVQAKPPPAPAPCPPMPPWASSALRGLDPFFQAVTLLSWKVLQDSTLGPAGVQHQRCSMPFSLTAEAMALVRMGSRRTRVLVSSLMPEEGNPHRCHWYGGSCVMVNDHQVGMECGDRTCEPLTANQCDVQVDVAPMCRLGSNAVDVFWPMGRGGAMAPVQAVHACLYYITLHETQTQAWLASHSFDSIDPHPAQVVLQLVSVRSVQEVRASLREPPTLQQHLACMAHLSILSPPPPPTIAPLSLPSALVSGGGGMDGTAVQGMVSGDGSPDDDIVQDKIRIGLRCPVGMMRIATPAYFSSCSADAVFDLDTFLTSVERSGKWKCPHTGRLCSAGELQVHTYLQAVLGCLQASPSCAEVDKVEVDATGLWRPVPAKGRSRAQWYDVLRPEVCVDGGAAAAPPQPAAAARQARTAKHGVRQVVVDLTGDYCPTPFTLIKLDSREVWLHERGFSQPAREGVGVMPASGAVEATAGPILTSPMQ
ncbi:MAG: hypothetical protein WDW38_000756 [Sanguina aurantia]